jgi:hypothetical protein
VGERSKAERDAEGRANAVALDEELSDTASASSSPSSLRNIHFKQAAWVAFNSPGFHEIDIMALVERWKADGHLLALMKDASGPRAKEVLERKAREHKVSFLG